MILSMLFSTAFLPGMAEAAEVPDAAYDLDLGSFDIDMRDFNFPSGLRVLFQVDHSQPIVSITNTLDRGSEYDGVGVNGQSVEGLAHVVEHLAFRARHGDLPQNWDVVAQLGGAMNASTSKDWTNYMTIAPVDATIPLLSLEARRLKDGVANISVEDVEAEKSIARNELRQGYENGSNGSAAFRTGLLYLPQLIFPEDHPYRNTTIGSHETINNIQLEDVQRYVQDHYIPPNSTLVVIGDFALDDSFRLLLQAFENDLDLLMSPDDATAFLAIEDLDEQRAFLEAWFPRLEEHLIASAQQQVSPRVDCGARTDPPPLQSEEVLRVKGMVDNPTVVVGWSLPGGYCDDDANMFMAGLLLRNYINITLDPEWNYAEQESAVEGLACSAMTDEYHSMMVCAIEQGAIATYGPDKLVDKVADALYMQWDRQQLTNPMYRAFNEWNFGYARMSLMAGTLRDVDQIASLWGRATNTSMFAHFTGDPLFYSRSIQSYAGIDLPPIQELAEQYINRDRMAAVIIEPMDEEERERLEASSADINNSSGAEAALAEHHTAEEDLTRLLFDIEQLTPEAIERVVAVPNVEKINSFTLDNGLRVAIMDHGEAPLVRVGLQVDGSNITSPEFGLDSFANRLHSSAVTSNNSSNEDPLRVAGEVYKTGYGMYAEGAAGNLNALLHKMRWHVEDYDWVMADKRRVIKGWINGAKKDGRKVDNWASRIAQERLYPNHARGRWFRPSDFEAMYDWGQADAQDWIFQKWQPANAELVIVGRIDPAEAEQLVRDYFAEWTYEGSGAPGSVAHNPPPSEQPDRQLIILDKPISTQSRVVLSCQLTREGEEHNARTTVIGEVLSDLVFQSLRAERGLTYGAYAYPRMYDDMTTTLNMATVIQNDGASFAVETMLGLIDTAVNGGIDEGAIATAKWNIARTSVLGLQSGTQMRGTLLDVGVGNFDYFNQYPSYLANVSSEGFSEAMEVCAGHEVITIVGPAEKLTPQFDEMGMAYELIDWESRYEAQLTRRELKKYLKAKEKAEIAAAEEAAAEAAAAEVSASAE